MNTMRVMRFNDAPAAPALVPGAAPMPTPGATEILVRIHAAGVTPTELIWYPTQHTVKGEVRRGAIVGHEFSGVVEAVGAEVKSVSVGQAILGMNDWFADGATAEYCLAEAKGIALKPESLSHADAASVPIGALTAWQGLFDRAKLQPGERVLIHGGSGAVGIFAIQLAKRAGAHVITTASARNFEFLKMLGADETIDYRAERFEDRVRDIDVVFDGVGGDTLHRSFPVLKPAGRVVTIAAASEGTKDERTEKAFFIVEPNAAQLAEIVLLLDKDMLRTTVDAIVPFERASDAYCGTIRERVGRGKTVLSLIG